MGVKARTPVAGEVIRHLTATGEYEIRKDRQGKNVNYWEFTCVMGCKRFLVLAKVINGRAGCRHTSVSVSETYTSGSLTTTGVVELRPHSKKNPSRGGETYWQVICSLCDSKCFRLPISIKMGKLKSCGCLNRERFRQLGKSHAGQPGKSSLRSLFASYKANAKTRGFAFDLTMDDFIHITKQNCKYCGVEPEQVFHPMKRGKPLLNGPYVYNGIDRVESEMGYEVDNCVPCCMHCNRAKMALSLGDFLSHITNIYWHSVGITIIKE